MSMDLALSVDGFNPLAIPLSVNIEDFTENDFELDNNLSATDFIPPKQSPVCGSLNVWLYGSNWLEPTRPDSSVG